MKATYLPQAHTCWIEPLHYGKTYWVQMCVSERNNVWPAIMKMTPPARATLSLLSGWSAMHVVHFMPTVSTKMEIVHSKMDAIISPRVACTIAGVKNTAFSFSSSQGPEFLHRIELFNTYTFKNPNISKWVSFEWVVKAFDRRVSACMSSHRLSDETQTPT